jgi:hypothetical protein
MFILLGSQPAIGAIAECCHCCCKERQQLSLLESPKSLRRCDHARPGQNLDLSDPARRLSDPTACGLTDEVELEAQ